MIKDRNLYRFLYDLPLITTKFTFQQWHRNTLLQKSRIKMHCSVIWCFSPRTFPFANNTFKKRGRPLGMSLVYLPDEITIVQISHHSPWLLFVNNQHKVYKKRLHLFASLYKTSFTSKYDFVKVLHRFSANADIGTILLQKFVWQANEVQQTFST